MKVTWIFSLPVLSFLFRKTLELFGGFIRNAFRTAFVVEECRMTIHHERTNPAALRHAVQISGVVFESHW